MAKGPSILNGVSLSEVRISVASWIPPYDLGHRHTVNASTARAYSSWLAHGCADVNQADFLQLRSVKAKKSTFPQVVGLFTIRF